MDVYDYFHKPLMASHKHYEALRAYYYEGLSSKEVSKKFGLSPLYFKKLRVEFRKKLRNGEYPYFIQKKTGPKKRKTKDEVVRQIIQLRKQNYSITDIKVSLEAKGIKIALDTINKILRAEGFAPLTKRTRRERLAIAVPLKMEAPRSVSLKLRDEEFSTELGAGPLIFLPLIENSGIIKAIREAGYPNTSEISDVQSVLSFLALKLVGNLRTSHDTRWNMDRALGLFAGLNVLPKATTLSTYSYRVSRSQNRNFLVQLSRIFRDDEAECGEFNLDFKAIPHWGDESVLERNWAGARSKALKSILSLIVQNPCTGYVSYTNAEIRHRDQKDAVIDFVDFWKKGRGGAPKMLIFDSKFTTYKNLDKLNQSEEDIKFLTLRRRSKNLIRQTLEIPEKQWQRITIERSKRKYRKIKVYDGKSQLRHYEGQVRQVIITGHGRQSPAYLITNDFDIDVREIVSKYARRWLVEQEIAEHILFFNLNNPSSSIVVKVDFDLTMSLLAHNLYRILAGKLPGFEHCTEPTINRKFLETGAKIKIKEKQITVYLKKKTHLPILFSVPWMQQNNQLSWLGASIRYVQGTIS